MKILKQLDLLEQKLIPLQFCQIGEVSYQLKFKAVKRLNLRIKVPEAQVLVTAPLGMPKRIIEDFVQKNQTWILKQQSRLKTQNITMVRRFVTGEIIYFWGRPYTLELRPFPAGCHVLETVQLKDDHLLLYLSEEEDQAGREKIIDGWFKKQLELFLPQVFEQCRQIVGKRESSFYVRKMKTRWGTCNIRTGRVCINSGLAHVNPKYVYYIVTHELTHLWVPGHGSDFRNRMDKYCPGWREARIGLREVMNQVW